MYVYFLHFTYLYLIQPDWANLVAGLRAMQISRNPCLGRAFIGLALSLEGIMRLNLSPLLVDPSFISRLMY